MLNSNWDGILVLSLLCTFMFALQDGGRAVMVDKEEIQRVVSSCNDFAEAEKRSKHVLLLTIDVY